MQPSDITHTPATQQDAALLWKLLHLVLGVQPDENGEYKGPRKFLTFENLCDHVSAIQTWGFVCVYRKKARFIGLDFDTLFLSRLKIVKEVLEKMHLADAAFATTGSTPEKGKVIICLKSPMPQNQAIALRDKILTACDRYPEFGGITRDDHVDKFPTKGEGGILRIGGFWKEQYNKLLTLDGQPLDMSTIRPYWFKPDPIKPTREKPGQWTRQIMAEPWTWTLGHQGIYKRMLAMAYEAIRIRGTGEDGEREYYSWLRQVQQNSPNLMEPSHSGDSRSVFTKDREAGSAWKDAISSERSWKRTSWKPKQLNLRPRKSLYRPKSGLPAYYETEADADNEQLHNEEDDQYTLVRAKALTGGTKVYKLPYAKAQGDVYLFLAEYSYENGIDPYRICKDLETIADGIGTDKGNVRRVIRQAEARELLIVLDPGCPRPNPTTAVYALISAGETRESVLKALGLTEESVAEIHASRRRERERERTLDLPMAA